jgi:hypothetical protein
MCLLATPFLAGTLASAQAGSANAPGASAKSALNGPSFIPDAKFKGSTLAGWHTVGQANWSAQNGELIGKSTGAPGWLMLDHIYQDVGFYTTFRCTGACDAGILLRAQKTAEGTKGVFISIKDGETDAYTVTLDASGNEVHRDPLRLAGGMIRYAPPATDAPERQRALPALPPGVTLPIAKSTGTMRNGEWNEIEVLLDADIVRTYLNDDGGRKSAATEDMDSYGPIALYVGKGSEIHFKDVSYKDLAIKVDPIEQVGSGFTMQRLSPYYYGWSSAAADFNRDGKLDIVSGAFIYYGPDFTARREIFPTHTSNPTDQYSLKIEHAYDFTGDGWPDVLMTSGDQPGAILYVNPKGESHRWKSYKVAPNVSSEDSMLADVDGDGKPDLVYVGDGYMAYASPNPADPIAPWVIHNVSEKGPWPAHGIGVGDINGDGRMDIVSAEGWWEQPASHNDPKPWRYHPEAFGRYGRIAPGGSQIGIYDVNGDGLNDVVTSLEAHGWGLAWFEQKRASNGDISFVQHMVMDNYNTQNAGGVAFSELHGTVTADIDGDGIPDFVVGKRQWSHNDDFLDPDVYGPALLYWYKTVRDPKAPGGAKLVPQLIDNSTGAGSDLLAVDLNGDGKMDIVTATKRGLYIFWGKSGPAKAAK